MKTQRNAKCPCGSGKKYKHCCMQRDLERARREETRGGYEEGVAPRFATWKIFVLGFVAIVALVAILGFVFDWPEVGGTVGCIGLLVLILYCAFRNEPTVRRVSGDSGTIGIEKRS